MSRTVILPAVLFVTLLAPAARADEFFFRPNDRIVMIGDSITEQHLYSNYVEMWVTTRFPEWKLTFRNVGISGDRSPGGRGRFARDVLVHKPTALTVDFGMNDGGYKPFDEPGFKNYVDGLQGMADQAKPSEIRIAWCTPQPLDNAEPGPTALTAYNLTLEKYSAGVKAIADKNGGRFVDQFHPYLAVLDRARGAAPKYDRITGGDAVHPGPPGQALMAASILQGLNFPRLVATVDLDVADPAGAKTENCRVTDVVADGEGSGVRFQRLDAALPFFPAESAPILKWAPLLKETNDYGLRVRGLKPGNYQVLLDQEPMGRYTAEELAAGQNLAAPALAAGPVADQVKRIRTAIEAKNRFYHDKIFRGVVLVNLGPFPDWLGVSLNKAEIESKRQAALAERMNQMPALDEAVRQALVIKPHTVSVERVK